MPISVAHYEFTTRLRNFVTDAGRRLITINVRIDGETTDSNIVVTTSNRREEWRVGPHGGQIRVNTWNLIGMLREVARWDENGDVQAMCERVINDKSGQYHWLRLVIRDHKVIRAHAVEDPAQRS